MSGWSADELSRIGGATELQLSSRRPDGSLRPYVTIWTVRAGDDIYVRSAYGPENGWLRRAITAGHGRVRAGGAERDVDFERADDLSAEGVNAAYHAKYDRYGPSMVGTVVSPEAVQTTLRLLPR